MIMNIYPMDSSLINKTLSSEQPEQMKNIEHAATSVIQKYGNTPIPSLEVMNTVGKSNGGSTWADPSLAMNTIVNDREEMVSAWDACEEGGQMDEDNGGTQTSS